MEKYMDRFIKCVPAKDVVVKWEVHDIINENTCEEVKTAPPSERNEILFKYIKKHGSLATIKKMCDLMIETGKDGYPNMRALGEEMKKHLEQYYTRPELNLYQEAKPRGVYVPFMCGVDVLTV